MTSNPKHILASKSNEHWTPAMAKKLTVDGAYIAAMNDCKGKCGCIKNKANNYVNITQNMWTKNQNDMIETRRQSKPTSDELDDEMKGRINHELRKVASTLLSTSVRVSLTFPVTMRIYSEPKDAHDMEPSKVLGTKEFFLCESCYVYYEYHKCFRTFRGWKSQIKDSIVLLDNMQDTVASVRKKVAYISAKYPSLTDKTFTHVNQARKAFAKYDLSPIEIQAICVPDGAGSLEAYGWLLEFFSLVGDSSPNRYEKVQIPGIYTKESIHIIYENHMKTLYSGNEHNPLKIRQFKNLWYNIFPNVSISKFCQVSGKCFTCWQLYLRQEIFQSASELSTLKEFSKLHKIMIERCRMAYIDNRQLAQTHPDLYMSLILDGMSQGHCCLPWYANKATETKEELKQKITGAKQHGLYRSFYRTYPHVKSGANLACEVLLREIEARMDYCKDNNKPFPKCLLLQVDGGPENASKTFYGLCEHLVREGVFERIDVSRLPVGHTHEDIDAMFGVLWRACQGKSIMSPEKWKQIALGAFTNEAKANIDLNGYHSSYDSDYESDDDDEDSD